MGYVLAAEDRRLDRRVALKFLLAPARNRPDIAARFEGEARTATKIVDEHVARVHTVEVTPEGESFIVMEHLEGKDLYQVIRARGPLPTVEAVPGPRSTIVSPTSLAMKKVVVWCVKSLESPYGTPSNVTLYCPS